MKLPGPDHPITITRNDKRVRVTFAGQIIADTHARADAAGGELHSRCNISRAPTSNMNLLKPTAHASHCPYKGDASYFSIEAAGRIAENAVWSYEQPFPAMAEITDYLAFYPQPRRQD